MNRKIRFILALALFIVASLAHAKPTPMGAEEKQQALSDFESALADGKYAGDLEKSLNSSLESAESSLTQQSSLLPQKENLYFGNGKYKINISYQLDVDFPKKYPGAYFSANKDEAFYDQWSSIIFEHYLGKDYAKHEPSLYAVAEVCTIIVLVSTLEELAELVDDQRIIRVKHIGTPYIPIEVTR